jgi:hypothetical protein
MDDNSDASQAIDDVVQALKLAGVSADEILDDLEASLITLAGHISNKS